MSQYHEALQKYHECLASIDRQHQEFKRSIEELSWYKAYYNEASTLATQYSFNDLSNETSLKNEQIELLLAELLNNKKALESNVFIAQYKFKAFQNFQDLQLVQLNRGLFLEIFNPLHNVFQSYHNSKNQIREFQGLRERRRQETLQPIEERRSKLEADYKQSRTKLDSAQTAFFSSLVVVSVSAAAAAYFYKDSISSWAIALGAASVAAILPLFNGHNLLTALVKMLKDSEYVSLLQAQLKELRYSLQGTVDRFDENERKREAQIKAESDRIRDRASERLNLIRTFTLSALYIAVEIESQKLCQEWQKQQPILDELIAKLEHPAWNWGDWRWQEFSILKSLPHPYSLFRIGELAIERGQGSASIPAILSLRADVREAKQLYGGNVAIFSNDSSSREAALKAMESLAVRTLASMPIRTCRCIFIDPVNAGNVFPFRNFPTELVGKQTYTSSEDIREQLHVLSQHVQQVTQNYLIRNYETIEEYNAAGADGVAIAEAYRYVFIADFPAGFERNALQDLKNLLQNGARAGVYVILHVDDTLEKPRDFSYDLLKEVGTILRPAYGLTTGGSYDRAGTLKVGYVYLGRVVRIIHSGAYVEFLPGVEGMLPTSQMTERRIREPEEAVSVGQVIEVKVNSIDRQERVTLTCLGIRREEANAAQAFAAESQNFQARGMPLFALQLPSGEAFRLCLDLPPSRDLFRQLYERITETIKNLPKDEEAVTFDLLYPKRIWSGNSSKNICAPIGMAGAKNRLEFILGMYDDGNYEPAHALLAGTTGSGKSYTLHALIFSLALHYSPEELELYLLDYKEGVEFQVYVTPDRLNNLDALNDPDPQQILPHARVISLESDAEFGLSVLERAIAEIEDRAKNFKAVGTPGIEAYREQTGKKLSRLLIIIDEYQQMYLQADSRLQERLNNAIEEITKQGRAFGVHLLLSSQSPRITNFRERIYEQVAVRMAMSMSRATASLVMAEGNTDVVELLDRAGKIAYNDRLGEKSSNRIGQVGFINRDARLAAMQKILETSHASNFQRSIPTVIFNGIQAAQLRNNYELKALTACDNWLPIRELGKNYLQQEKDWIPLESPCATWLGESMQIDRQVRAIFRRRPRNHILLIGSSEIDIFGILGGLFIGLIHTSPPQQLSFYIADLALSEGEVGELMPLLRDSFGNTFEILLGKRFADRTNQILRAEEVWQQVVQEFERRQEIHQTNPDDRDFGKSLFFILALGNLGQMECFRSVPGRSGDEMSPDTKKLLEISSKGSELGIHLVMWLGNAKTLQQLFVNNRSAVSFFDLRVALKMNDRDSVDFMGDNCAKNLRDYQAYFTDASTPDIPEKFRSYSLLNAETIVPYLRVRERCS